MASNAQVFNIAKGRVAELYNRVQTNDPANSALIVVLLAASGLESDATLVDKTTLAAVLAGSTNEATNTGYARKVLTDADLSAISPDNTSDLMLLDTADLVWINVANDGTGNIAKLVFCWDRDTTSGTDTDIVPLTMSDFPAVPNGQNITANISGFFEAD